MIQYYIVFFPVTVSELTDILSGKFYMPLRASASTDSSDAAFSTFSISKTYITPSVDFFSPNQPFLRPKGCLLYSHH